MSYFTQTQTETVNVDLLQKKLKTTMGNKTFICHNQLSYHSITTRLHKRLQDHDRENGWHEHPHQG